MGFLSITHTKYFLIALLVCFSGFGSCFSYVNDTITSTGSIRDHETITSSQGNFTIGFFSPENSTNRYVAIWYIHESNIVWIANRDSPLKDSSGVFKIHKDGNLVVLDGRNDRVMWSSNVSRSSLLVANTSAQLEDTGNLVLRDGATGVTIWDSFSNPCDVAIRGMRIAANRITGKKIEYVSRKSPNDPSSGEFSATLERLDAPECFLWRNRTQPYWRTGPWNGRVLLGAPRMSTEYLYGWSVGHDDDGTIYLTYNFADPSVLGILTLTPNGKLRLVRFFNKVPVLTLEVDQNECDFYGTCGPNGNCDPSKSPICSCFDGFEPRNPGEWSRKNWTSGCVRTTTFQCGEPKKKSNGSEVQKQAPDGFIVHHTMKVPNFAERSDGNQDKCGTDCLANCSCLAYAYDPYIGCMYWSGDLIDLQKFPQGGVDLFLRVPHSQLVKNESKSESEKGKGSKAKALIIGVIVGLITLAISAFLLRQKWKAKQTGTLPQRSKTDIGEVNKMKLEELPIFEFEKLAAATNNFHFGTYLGKGGFGQVYKGQFEDGQEIAVKRLSKASGQGLEEFMNEVVVISKLQHRNLVRLLGCCIEQGEQMLVYEFMPNKSLDAFLFDPTQRKGLDWKKRFNIIEGVARGILYLHRDSRLRIIHRDLKASNILLDDEMNPKISDFGLARIFKGGEDDEANTRRVVGTYGYMPPEYAMEGLFSEKSDVYSYGVLLLEIVSGRRNTSFYNNEQSLSLVGLAWKLWNESNTLSLVDPEIWDPRFETSMLRCIQIGLLCVQEVTRERPTISTVVLMLISEITNLPAPGPVAFVHKHSHMSSESSQKTQSNSNNNVTLSELQAR